MSMFLPREPGSPRQGERIGGGGSSVFSPRLSSSLPPQVWLPVEGREGRGGGERGEVATESCALQAWTAASPSAVAPQKELRSYPAKVGCKTLYRGGSIFKDVRKEPF